MKEVLFVGGEGEREREMHDHSASAALPVHPSGGVRTNPPRHGAGYVVADHHEINSHCVGVLGGAGHGVAGRHAQGEQQEAGRRAARQWERAILGRPSWTFGIPPKTIPGEGFDFFRKTKGSGRTRSLRDGRAAPHSVCGAVPAVPHTLLLAGAQDAGECERPCGNEVRYFGRLRVL